MSGDSALLLRSLVSTGLLAPLPTSFQASREEAEGGPVGDQRGVSHEERRSRSPCDLYSRRTGSERLAEHTGHPPPLRSLHLGRCPWGARCEPGGALRGPGARLPSTVTRKHHPIIVFW